MVSVLRDEIPFGVLLLTALSWAAVDWAFRPPPGPLREDRLTQALMGLAILATLVALALGWDGLEPGEESLIEIPSSFALPSTSRPRQEILC